MVIDDSQSVQRDEGSGGVLDEGHVVHHGVQEVGDDSFLEPIVQWRQKACFTRETGQFQSDESEERRGQIHGAVAEIQHEKRGFHCLPVFDDDKHCSDVQYQRWYITDTVDTNHEIENHVDAGAAAQARIEIELKRIKYLFINGAGPWRYGGGRMSNKQLDIFVTLSQTSSHVTEGWTSLFWRSGIRQSQRRKMEQTRLRIWKECILVETRRDCLIRRRVPNPMIKG